MRKIARFDGGKIGVVTGDRIIDVTAAAQVDPGEWPPVGMLRLIATFETLRGPIERPRAAGPGSASRKCGSKRRFRGPTTCLRCRAISRSLQ